ncbi:MAG: hypothetical protein WAT81_02530 [Candidatus Moraniibacteriota bacterium]
MYLIEYLWSHWLLVAFLAPFSWALVNIIDVYFVEDVYEDEWDGIIISSLFQFLPWLLPIFGLVSFVYPGLGTASLAFIGGGFLTLAFFFYFKTLFTSNDVVVIGALWNLSVPLVPFLAWLLIDEQLTSKNYAGVLLAFIGATIFVFHEKIKTRNFGKVAVIMSGAIFFISLSMVTQTVVYRSIGEDFWTGFLLFSTGSTMTGIVLMYFDRKSIQYRVSHLYEICRKYYFVFFLAESLNLIAVLSSQRAIHLSPAVSFVAVIESAVPIFALLLSLLAVFFFVWIDKSKAQRIYRDQLVGFKTKLLACCIIAVGIYLIS